jgi:hypothetical protein
VTFKNNEILHKTDFTVIQSYFCSTSMSVKFVDVLTFVGEADSSLLLTAAIDETFLFLYFLIGAIFASSSCKVFFVVAGAFRLADGVSSVRFGLLDNKGARGDDDDEVDNDSDDELSRASFTTFTSARVLPVTERGSLLF